MAADALEAARTELANTTHELDCVTKNWGWCQEERKQIREELKLMKKERDEAREHDERLDREINDVCEYIDEFHTEEANKCPDDEPWPEMVKRLMRVYKQERDAASPALDTLEKLVREKRSLSIEVAGAGIAIYSRCVDKLTEGKDLREAIGVGE